MLTDLHIAAFFNAVLAIVTPSVRLSDKRVNCDKTDKTSDQVLIPYERSMHVVFRHEKNGCWEPPLLPEIWGQIDPFPCKITTISQHSLVQRLSRNTQRNNH